MIEINQPIINSEVGKQVNTCSLEVLNEKLDRPSELAGITYKISPPITEHAFYITINDIVLNAGTENEERRPFEVFINTKNTEAYQWILALTRLISAVFRKGGDFMFVVEELMSTFDPHGGYFLKGGGMCPSIVAEIGRILKQHINRTKPVAKPQPVTKEYKKEKKATGQICPKCQEPTLKVQEGCMSCGSCGFSKCG